MDWLVSVHLITISSFTAMLRSVSLRALGFRGGGRIGLSPFAPTLSAAAVSGDGGGRLVSFVGTYWGRGAHDEFHGHSSTPCKKFVRTFSGIRNIPRNEALKYMPAL